MISCFRVNGSARKPRRGRLQPTAKKPAFPSSAESKTMANVCDSRGKKKSILSIPSLSPKQKCSVLDTCPNGCRPTMRARRCVTKKKTAVQVTAVEYYTRPRMKARAVPIEHACAPIELYCCNTFQNLPEKGTGDFPQAPLTHDFPANSMELSNARHAGCALAEARPSPPCSTGSLPSRQDEDVFGQVVQESHATPATIDIASPASEYWAVSRPAHDLRFEKVLDESGMELFQAPFLHQAAQRLPYVYPVVV